MYIQRSYWLAKSLRGYVWALFIFRLAPEPLGIPMRLDNIFIVEGTAYLQERGTEIVIHKPGDTVYTAPGVEHWHGASGESFMVHLAIWEAPQPGTDGPETNWGDQVSDLEYGEAL